MKKQVSFLDGIQTYDKSDPDYKTPKTPPEAYLDAILEQVTVVRKWVVFFGILTIIGLIISIIWGITVAVDSY